MSRIWIDDVPMMVDPSVADSIDWSRPIAPGELRMTTVPVDGDLSKFFYRLPKEFPEEDFIASVMA